MGVTNACSQSLGSLPVLYDCWKMWVMMGAICFAVSLRTMAWSFRFSSWLITPSMPISRRRMLGVSRWGYFGDRVLFLGKYRAKLVV